MGTIMKKYILHRLLYLIPILLGITLFTFILLHSTNDIVDIMESFIQKPLKRKFVKI